MGLQASEQQLNDPPGNDATTLLFVIYVPHSEEVEIFQACIDGTCVLCELYRHESVRVTLITELAQPDDVVRPRAATRRRSLGVCGRPPEPSEAWAYRPCHLGE